MLSILMQLQLLLTRGTFSIIRKVEISGKDVKTEDPTLFS